MKKKDLEDNIVCFASYLDYCKTEAEKRGKSVPSFGEIYKNVDKLFNEVIQSNRVAYAAYRLSLAVDDVLEENIQKEK